MFKLSTQGKKRLAKLVKLWPVRVAQTIAVRLFAPKHYIGVNTICVDEQNRVLLLNHVFHPQYPWGLPGGWLDPKEQPIDCAAREIREETGLEIEIENLAQFSYKTRPFSHLIIIYRAHVTGGQLNLNNNEIIEARWFATDELPDGILPMTKATIQEILNGDPSIPVPQQGDPRPTQISKL